MVTDGNGDSCAMSPHSPQRPDGEWRCKTCSTPPERQPRPTATARARARRTSSSAPLAERPPAP
eukprot:7322538-Prymnesium_polylepis.1